MVYIYPRTSLLPAHKNRKTNKTTPPRTLGAKTTDIEIQKQVTLDYTLAAATALSASRAPAPQPLRFVFASGILAVRDQSKSVWFGSGARHIKGEAETRLLDFSAAHRDSFDAFIVRPGMVMESAGGVGGVAVWAGVPAVSVQGLAAVMVELAVRGGGEKVWENRELGGRGRELLKRGEARA